MSRRAAVVPNERLELKLEPTLKLKLDLYLWSELEGRVPKGKYKDFFEERLRDFFAGLEERRIIAKMFSDKDGVENDAG